MYNRIRRWEPWLVPFLPQHGDIAFDIGAAEGKWTLDLAERFRTVVAVEPHPDNYAKLKKAIEGAHPAMTIIPMQGAVAKTSGTVNLHQFRDPEHTSILAPTEVDAFRSESLGGTQPSRSWSLHDLVFGGEWGEDSVDFIKIDTEGAEVQILEGGATVADRWHPVFLVEYHSHDNLHSCRHLLEFWKYKVQIIPHPDTRVSGHGWMHAS